MRRLIAVALSLCCTVCAPTQTRTQKYPLKIDCMAAENDPVGRSYCVELRDAVARSPRYRFADKHEKVEVITIQTVTIAALSTISAISNAYIDDPFFLTQNVRLCGSEHVAKCAQDTIADVDDILAKRR